MNNAQRVNKYLGFLVTEYNMHFSVDELDNAVGVEKPTYVYSYYNDNGCFSVVEIAQRDEWDCYYAECYTQEPRLRLSKKISQRSYMHNSVYTTGKFLKLTASAIHDQISQQNSFWGICVQK